MRFIAQFCRYLTSWQLLHMDLVVKRESDWRDGRPRVALIAITFSSVYLLFSLPVILLVDTYSCDTKKQLNPRIT